MSDKPKKFKIILVQEDHYYDLCLEIQEMLIHYGDSYELFQIDYFGMSEKEDCPCSAIIVFKEV